MVSSSYSTSQLLFEVLTEYNPGRRTLQPIYKLVGFTVLSLARATLRFHKSLD